MKALDLVGQKFGRLLVQSRSASRGGKSMWACICDCGKSVDVCGTNMTLGVTKSCGCLISEFAKSAFTTHGMSKTRTYRIWRDMINRCHYEKYPERHLYGGRGIVVCDKWRASFDAFLVDMGVAPGWGSIDRINSNGNYEPSNCRWATASEQARNQRPRETCQRVKDRCAVLLQRRVDGETYAAIGRSIGVGESRVRQLVKKAKLLQGAA